MKKFLSVLLAISISAAVCAFAACSKKEQNRPTHYDIFVSYDEEKSCVGGTVGLDYVNTTGNELSDLKFNLYGNAFREGAAYPPVSKTYKNSAYYAGVNYGGMEITNVENCAGWNVGGEDENILTVNLTEPLYPGDRVTVKISYTLSLAKINHRTGVTADAVNLGNFYPVLCAYSREGFIECPYYTYGDPFVSECADYDVTVDMPESFTAAASGQKVSETTADGRKKCQYVLSFARDFALVLSDKFNVLSEEANGVEVQYYYVSDGQAEANLKIAAESLQYFSSVFGNYTYPTLSVVQTGFCYGGMEYPGLTMIARGLSEGETQYTIVHENAHQWWYAMVGNDQLTCPWQDEGLAEYSTVCFFEAHPEYGYTRTGLVGAAIRSYRSFFSVYSQLNEQVDTSMTRNLGTYSSELEYNNVVYNKGTVMFDTLRESLGDEKFFSALKNYFAANCGKIASADSLIAIFAASGVDVEGFFDSFIRGKIIL